MLPETLIYCYINGNRINVIVLNASHVSGLKMLSMNNNIHLLNDTGFMHELLQNIVLSEAMTFQHI